MAGRVSSIIFHLLHDALILASGSFWEFHRVIPFLTNPPEDQPAFHVVVPSLPGFGFSSAPPKKQWTMADNARILDHLMTGVLGYSSYMASGGDWGSLIVVNLGTDRYPACKLLELTTCNGQPTFWAMLTLPFFLLPTSWRNWLYSKIYTEDELHDIARSKSMAMNGMGYFLEQATRPCTIGYAINDSPIGILAWIGEKYHDLMDPEHVPGATEFILTTVSLYFLTGSFTTSTLPYHENSFKTIRMTKPFGGSRFPYDVFNFPMGWMKAHHRKMVFSRVHHRGGHFPGYEMPEELATDLRDLVSSQSGLFSKD